MKIIHNININEQILNKRVKKDLTTTGTNLVEKRISQNEQQQQISAPLSRAKFEFNDSPNEFTSGYVMKPVEIVVIAFVLIIWVFSLRKFFKTFGKLRTTHYRDVPYKYKLKDPENISHIKVINNQTDSVIYSRDPIKSLKIYHDEILPIQGRSSSTPSETIRNKLKNDLFTNPKIGSNSFSCLNMYENEPIYDNGYFIDANLGLRKNSYSNGNVLEVTDSDNDNRNLLNPLYSLSPIVRKSLLDLHKKSMENLAQASMASNGNSEHTTPKSGRLVPKLKSNSIFNNNNNYTNKKRDYQKEHLTVKFLESPV